jgi:2,3-bisphosphoglycerate-independent phosphoglycerate mutase
MITIPVKPFLLLILDGWGYREEKDGNAILAADTPTWDQLWQQANHTLISGSGTAVGLPQGQMGNSEVGHLNIGAGRVVYQDYTRIENSIADGSFQQNTVLIDAIDSAIQQDKAVHILGLLSDGGVHSHQNHIHAALELAAIRGVKKLYLHAFLDGRDTPPRSAQKYLAQCEAFLTKIACGQIASLTGRYYAMDRDQRWERVQACYELLSEGKTHFHATSAQNGLDMAYSRGENDEFVKPTAIHAADTAAIQMNDGDSVIFMNFRADRAREISQCLWDNNFNQFPRQKHPQIHFATLTEYADYLKAPIVFKPIHLSNVLGEYLAKLGKTQLRIAETEKYAHVTFFFNGGREAAFTNEDRILIPSPKVATYDLQPEMSAEELTDKLTQAITAQKYDVIICNFANPDMVGHTGILSAAICAIETVDACLAKILLAIKQVGGEILITADHGNVEQMVDANTGQAHTAHTNEPVPLVYVGRSAKFIVNDGNLSDLAPTLLYLMDLTIPPEMTGRIILQLQ